MSFLSPNQQCQSTEGNTKELTQTSGHYIALFQWIR